MSKRWVFHDSYMPNSGFHNVLWIIVVSRCIFELSSYQPHHWRRIKNIVYHSIWNLLLYKNGVGVKEWESYISEVYSHHFGVLNWENCESYIDDVVVKSKNVGIRLMTSKIYSTIFVSIRWWLILKKYVFDVSSERLLDYMVSSLRINVTPRVTTSLNIFIKALIKNQIPWVIWFKVDKVKIQIKFLKKVNELTYLNSQIYFMSWCVIQVQSRAPCSNVINSQKFQTNSIEFWTLDHAKPELEEPTEQAQVEEFTNLVWIKTSLDAFNHAPCLLI
jgi:hypothetical protein